MKYLKLSLLIIILSINFAFAANDFAYNRLYGSGQVIDGLNYSINVNSSENWITNIGSLGDVNDTQFENNGGFLSIALDWLGSIISSDSGWNKTNGDVILTDINDNVGVGTDNPTSKLNVIGDGNFTGNLSYWNDVMKRNNLEHVYIRGDEDTDGSLRFAINVDYDDSEIQRRIDGLWQPTSLRAAPLTIWTGPRAGIGAAADHIITKDSDGKIHFHAHSPFNNNLSTGDSRIINVYAYTPYTVVQPDDSGIFTGTELSYVQFALANAFYDIIFYRTGPTAATSPIRIRIWRGTNESGTLYYDRVFPTSLFIANSNITATVESFIDAEPNVAYFVKWESAANFSLRTDVNITNPWLATNGYFYREDDMLQVEPFDFNSSKSIGDWTIQNNKIYVNNITGIQIGNFSNNTDKWQELGAAQGPNESIQFNKNGLLKGVSNFIWDDTENALNISGSLYVSNNLTVGGCTTWYNGTEYFEDC